MIIHKDCHYFCGAQPCVFHKQSGVHCDGCEYYKPAEERILIVKLAAVGDVLRTTSLLPGLSKTYPNAHITWLTDVPAVQLLENNPFINRLWAPAGKYTADLLVEEFDIVINPDAEHSSCSLAALARAKEHRGFVLNLSGEVLPLSAAAQRWFEMGLFDNEKKKNTKTYGEILSDIAEIEFLRSSPNLFLSWEERERGKRLLYERNGYEKKRPVIGINTGAGGRWSRKSLTISALKKLVSYLLDEFPDTDIFLLGGPEEFQRNEEMLKYFNNHLVDTGTDNTLRQFAAIIDLTDVVITADTLALHIGLALNKFVIVNFGPTSSSEIDVYDRGIKVVPDLDCLCCYMGDCNEKPACNEIVDIELIADYLHSVLARSGTALAAGV